MREAMKKTFHLFWKRFSFNKRIMLLPCDGRRSRDRKVLMTWEVLMPALNDGIRRRWFACCVNAARASATTSVAATRNRAQVSFVIKSAKVPLFMGGCRRSVTNAKPFQVRATKSKTSFEKIIAHPNSKT